MNGGPARTRVLTVAMRAAAMISGAATIGTATIHPAVAQQIDMSHGGPIGITASDGIEWHQAQQQVIANGNAKAVRDNVTVTADRLLAWYRKKAAVAGAAQPASGATASGTTVTGNAAPGTAAPGTTAPGTTASDADTAGNEVYRVRAVGNVHIYTQTDQVWGDDATYDMDQAVMVITGHNLKLTTQTEILTARDDIEYWSQRHMAVARGDAVVVTNDGRRFSGDTLVAYTADTPAQGAAPRPTPVAAQPGSGDPLASSGKLEKVEAYGHVIVRTVTDTVTGDRAVYVPDSGIARVAGKVRITRGQNQLDGSEAEVNTKTGISRLLAGNAGRVQGLVVPNDQTSQALAGPGTVPTGTNSAGTNSTGTNSTGTNSTGTASTGTVPTTTPHPGVAPPGSRPTGAPK